MNVNSRFSWMGYSIAVFFGIIPLRATAQKEHNNPDLPPPAVKVWSNTPLASRYSGPVLWLTDKILLYDISTDYKHVRQHNLTDSSDETLDTLNKQLQMGSYTVSSQYHLSPDGTKLLYWIDHQLVIYTLDGKRVASSAIGTYDRGRIADPYCWLSNSRSWAELCIDGSQACTGIRIHTGPDFSSVSTLPVSPPIAVGIWQPISTADGRLLIYKLRSRYFKGGDTDTGDEFETVSGQLIAFSILSGNIHTQVKSVHLPIRGGRTDPYPAPAGDRLVWNVRSSIAHHRKESLWVSRLDGTHARRLLEVNWEAPSYYMAFRDLTWLPDAKRISFVYEGSLWMLPIE